MKIRISQFCTQPGVRFKISHKVIKVLGHVITSRLIDLLSLDEKKSRLTLSLMIGTAKEIHRTEAKGPSQDRKNKWDTWGLWLPYDEIMQSADPLEAFIDKFFEAVCLVLTKYGITTEGIEAIVLEVKAEILGKDEYKYREVETPESDRLRALIARHQSQTIT